MTPDRHIAGDVRSKRRLADARSCGDHDQVAGLESDVRSSRSRNPEGKPVYVVSRFDVLQVDHGLINEVAKDGDLFVILAGATR